MFLKLVLIALYTVTQKIEKFLKEKNCKNNKTSIISFDNVEILIIFFIL